MKYNDFIKRAKLVHGDKYYYPIFDNIPVTNKIKIICSIHGEFEQVMYAHLRGQGCPKCVGIRKGYTTDDFIKDAKEKFGDKFDYSKVEYRGKRYKVCIMCKELICEDNPNGEFYQKPFVHLESKTGLPFRGKRGKKYTEIKDEAIIKEKTKFFIEKARKVHGNKYDYSKTKYIGAFQKVCIICPKHGEFWQTPDCHLRNHGCKKCHKNIPMSVEEFIEKAKEVHGDKYDYSLVDNITENKKIKIICKKHGIFEQIPYNHLKGHKCPLCAKNKKRTLEEFIEKAKEVHGDKYDYSKAKYINNITQLCIICPKHGEFWQTPANHLKGCACPICNESKLEKTLQQFFEEKNIVYESQKTFSNIIFKSKLPFDFYLPQYNIAIECQGIQHFVKSKHFEDEYRFIKDKIKFEGCIKNNIKLLYLTNEKNYKQFFNEIYTEKNLFNNKNKLLEEIKKVRMLS